MKKTIISATLLVLMAYSGKCQLLNANDTLALKIPEQDTYSTNGISGYVKTHFPSDSEQLRALFVWVANNISYDIEKLRNRKQTDEKTTPVDVLKVRKGVCQDYSELLAELCIQCNIRSILVVGYSKRPDGLISDVSHEWLAAQVNSKWYLFDPTWAAGPVYNDQFTKKFSNRYYKVPPEEMIKDHMPFDPMYQFLNYPVKYNEFYDGKTGMNTEKPFFNYADTMSRYNSLAVMDQTRDIARRIQNNGRRNDLIQGWLDYLNKKQEHIVKKEESENSKSGYDAAMMQYKQGTVLFNQYMDKKRARFAPVKDDNEIQQMIDSVLQYIKTAKSLLTTVVGHNEEQKQILYKMNNSLTEFKARVDMENEFLKKYLQTDKALRKM